ncbi:MAG TPA: hypothetical protein VMJ10_11365 [Kofleriaceae bacterium]|nr:hypothetical protein [Kofleriaceae bacterium]
MARGSKANHTSKQKRQARNIEDSAKKRGTSTKRATQIGYATVTKQDAGGKKGNRRKARRGRRSAAARV